MNQPVYGQPMPMQPGMMVAPTRATLPVKPKPSNGAIMGLVAMGGIMLLVGVIILQARTLIKAPSYGPEYDGWLNLMRYMAFIGALFIDIGAFFMILVGPYSAISRQDLPDRVRRAMIGLSTAIGVAWLIVMTLTGGITAGFP